jgi:hypothetical protein
MRCNCSGDRALRWPRVTGHFLFSATVQASSRWPHIVYSRGFESRATYLRLVDAARLRRDGKAGLWSEPDLTYARQWQEREAPNAIWAERYGSGFEDANAFLHDSEAAHAEELDRERQRARMRRLSLALVVFLPLALGIGIYGQYQRMAAEKWRGKALSRQLAAQATNEIGRNLPRAFLLAMAGYRIDPTNEARQSLQRALVA